MYNGYGYDFNYRIPDQNPFSGVLTGLIGVWIIILLLAVVLGLVSYILKGFGMYTMAQRKGMDNPWLAFIPFARTYLQGELSGDITFKNRTMRDTGIWLLALPFMYGTVFSIYYVIMCLLGLGTFVSMIDYYGNIHVGVGRILILIVLVLIIVLISAAYDVLYKVFRVLVNRQIYRQMTSGTMSVVHAVLSVLVPMYESVSFFVMRNRSLERPADGVGTAEPEMAELKMTGYGDIDTETEEVSGFGDTDVETEEVSGHADTDTETEEMTGYGDTDTETEEVSGHGGEPRV